ncbi:MAG: hypothetical protein J2P17_31180, partial [Mycobacterium sp.]|nr:hypothetical protein [Mycobacterium sp.]
FQDTHQLLSSEDTDPYNIGMATASGAYFIQTNMGGSEYPRTAQDALSGKFDPSIGGYRVNAAAAKFSKVVAARIYGARHTHRIYGYLYGGSGGAYQTATSAETTVGVWDGFVPFVMGTPQAIPNVFTVRVHALRVLKDKWPSILDAIEPGGSGDPYAGLNAEQRAALQEATRYGFPPRAWFNYVPMGGGPLSLVAGYVPILDPTYVDDFWTKPGYEGTDPSSSVRQARIQFPTTVAGKLTLPMGTQGIQLTSLPAGDIVGADVIVTSGAAAGKTFNVLAVVGNLAIVLPGFNASPADFNAIQPGDKVRVDNSAYLALQTYHRHQIPTPGSPYDYPVYDQFRNPDGTPIYPQRNVLVGPIGAFNATGEINNGHIRGKMILIENLLDGDAIPWQADWYRQKVQAALGKHTDDSFRLWFTDNAQHAPGVGGGALSPPLTATEQTHVVDYQGELEQALRDVSGWVEHGTPPPASTKYKVVDGQVEVPATAGPRKGIQPVVDLRADGGKRADVAVGQPVTFTAKIQVPPSAGKVVGADWDFEGVGNFPVAAQIKHPAPTVTVTASYSFSKPGTYFPLLRAASQRQG